MDSEVKAVATIVKALINSRKPPVFLSEIVNDYLKVEGKALPYRALGFNPPED